MACAVAVIANHVSGNSDGRFVRAVPSVRHRCTDVDENSAVTLRFFVCGAAVMAAAGLLLASKWFRRRVEAKRTAGTARTFPRHFAIAMHDCLRRPMRMLLAFVLALAFHAMCVLIQMLLAAELGIRLGRIDWIAIYAGVSPITIVPFSIAGIRLREGGYVGLLYLF